MTDSNTKPTSLLRRTLMRPLGFMGCAYVIAGLFILFNLLGWKDDTSIISGTSTGHGSEICGVLYGLSYFAAVILCPILIIAAILGAAINVMTRKPQPVIPVEETEQKVTEE